jgi:Zn-dependent protease
MLPIYPLDGQKVILGLMGGPAALSFERFSQRYGMMLLFALIFLGRGLLHTPMMWVAHGILGLFGL